MKIFIEIESGLGGIEEVLGAIGEATAEATRDLRDGGIYEDGSSDHVVELTGNMGLPMGRLIMTTNKEMKISD